MFRTFARRWWIRALAALALLVVAVAVIVHTPPVRRAALRQAIAVLQDRFNIVLDAESLRYNMVALRATLSRVELSATTAPDTPFLRADALVVDLPWSILYGPFSLESATLENARVHIARRRDGTSNLPPSQESTGDPAPIPIGRLLIPRIAIEVSDESSDLEVSLPALVVDVGSSSGTLRLSTPGVVRRGAERTEVTRIGGEMSFDGRAVHLGKFAVETSEAALLLDGAITLFDAKPSVDLALSGTGDVDRATRWVLAEPRPTGTLAVDGRLAGAMASPVLALRVRSDALAWQEMTASNVTGVMDLDAQRLRVDSLEAGFAGGRVAGEADVTFERNEVVLAAGWTDLDAAWLVRALAPGAAVTPAGRASGTVSMKGTGSDLAQWEIVARNQMARGRAGPKQLVVAGTATLTVGAGRWRLVAEQSIAEAPLRATLGGRLRQGALASSTVDGVLRIADTDLPSLIGALSSAGLLNVPPGAIGTLRGEVRLAGTLEAPRLQIAASAAGVSAGGVNDIEGDLTATGDMRTLAIDARVRQDSANTALVTGTVSPGSEQLNVHVTARIQEPSRLANVPIAGILDVEFDGAGPFTAVTGRGSVKAADLTYDNIALGPLESAIELDAGIARIRASLAEFRTTAEARVAVAAPHDATVDLRIDAAGLERLTQGRGGEPTKGPLPSPLTGVVSLTAHATGRLDEWRQGMATVNISQFEGRTGELTIRLLAPAQASYGDGIAHVASLDAAVGETHVSIAGDLPVLDGARPVQVSDALRATLTGDVAQVLNAVRATGLVDVPPVSGRGPLALLARVTGSVSEPVLAADFELGPGSIAFGELPSITGLQLRSRLREGWLELDEAAGEWQGSRIAASGRLPLSMLESYIPPAVIRALPPARGDASLDAKATSLTPRVLEPFLDADTVAQLEGTVDASLHLSGPSLALDELQGEMRLDRLDLRIANLPVTQRQPTRIVVGGGLARVEAWDWAGEGATLAVQGQVRLEDQQAALQANGRFDLRMFTPFVRGAGLSTAGMLEPRIAITGALQNPNIDGQVQLSAGEVRLADPRIVATDLSARAELSRTSGRIVSLSGSVNGGPLTGEGRFAYGANEPLSAELALMIQEMALNFPEGLRSELSAALTLQLQEDARAEALGGTLSGTVTILRSSYREPLAVATALLTRLRTERIAAEAAPEPDSLAERLALNIRVITEEDISVDNNYGRMELGGDLRVIGTAAAPAISGRATLREGGQLFLGRNTYTVDEGTIDFANPITIEPNMNIVANTRVGRYDIELTIMGTPANLSVEPRAVNSPEPVGVADLWSLLLTGRRLDEVSGDEAEIVGEQVLGYVSGDVLGLASRAVGLDTIRLGGIDESELRRDPTALATKVDPTARLTFGESIGDKLDVTFSQSLRDSNAQTWIVDYLPARQLGLRLVSDDEDLRSYEFRHDVSFGDDRVVRPAASTAERRAQQVVDVSVAGNLVLPEPRVRSALRMSPGDTFDFVEWQRDRDRLEELYREEGYREARISATRRETPEGITVSYDIDAGPRTAIAVTGYQLSSRTRAAIEEAWDGAVFDGFLIDDVTGIVRSSLAEDGYLRAEVTASIANTDVKTLSIAIAPGERTTEYRVRLEGADTALVDELDEWMRERRLDDLARREPATLESALTNELRARGHLRAQVRLGASAFEGQAATLPVTIDAGPVFTVSEVSLEGARTLYDASLSAIGIEAGAPYDPAGMDAARERVTMAYRRAGFSDVRVTTRPEINADARQVKVVFAIEEGPRQVLQEVVVSGNSGIDTDVVTRALGVKLGDPLGPETWLQARARVFETGLFRRVDLTVEPVEDVAPNAETRPMRVQIIVQEWPRLRLRYGFALQEERPEAEIEGRDLVPGLSADVTRRTLFGRAITVGAAMEYQRREQLGRGFVNAPTMFGLPIESSLTVERSREDFADAQLVTDRSGISWEQRFRFSRRLRLSYSYRFERDRTFDTAPANSPIEYDVTVNIARLTGTAAYDTRDSPTDSTRGWLLSSSLDYAPESGGSDIRFVRQLGQAYYFRPWHGTVLASAARLGLATALAGQELISSERFFAGGARTVRGAAEDGLGPRDFFGAVGGQGLLILNQEVRFPLYRWFRGVGFVNAGNVFPGVSDISLGNLTGSVGVGLRLTTPFAILRADYGRLWSPDDTGRSGRWTFGIGQAF